MTDIGLLNLLPFFLLAPGEVGGSDGQFTCVAG